MEGSIAEIADVILDFPEPKYGLLRRPNLVSALHNVFERGARIVSVEGPNGIGATSFLSDFVLSFPRSTSALFIRSESTHGYDIEYLGTQLFEQLFWHVEARRPNASEGDWRQLRRLIYKTQRGIARERPFYFVIDGLTHVPSKEQQRAIVAELLPLALASFRFVFSGRAEEITRVLGGVAVARPYDLAPFSKDEAFEYMSNVLKDRNDREQIYHLTDGVPGRIASVMGAIEDGQTLDRLLTGRRDELIDFIRVECERLEQLPEHLQEMAAAVVFAKHPITVEYLARLSKLSEDQVRESLKSMPYARVGKGGEVRASSEEHRRYLAKVLEHKRTRVLDRMLEDALSRGGGGDLEIAPAYFAELERNTGLLEYMDSKKLNEAIQTCSSLPTLEAVLVAGAHAAKQEKVYDKFLRFASARALVKEAGQLGPISAELDALFALGQKERALALALEATLVEHRLALLSRFAYLEKKSGDNVDASTLEMIEALARSAKLDDNDRLAVAIAADLLSVSPELALEIIESAAGKRPNRSDIALAALSIESTRGQSNPSVLETLDGKALPRIANKTVLSVAIAASGLVDKMAASEVLARVSGMPTQQKVFLLSCWVRVNQREVGALEVASAGLDAMLADQKFLPTLSELRELALPLRHSKDKEKVLDFVARFDAQKAIAKSRSAAEDHVRLEMLLVEALRPWSSDSADTRVSNLHLEISRIKDHGTRVDCLAWFIARAPDIDPDGEIERKIGLFGYARVEWWNLLKFVLENTGEHTLVVDASLRAFARVDIDTACEIVSLVNTRNRRDECYEKIGRLYARAGRGKLLCGKLRDVLERIEEGPFQHKGIARVLEVLADFSGDELQQLLGLDDFLRWVATCVAAVDASTACNLWIVRIAEKVGLKDELQTTARDSVISQLPRIEPEWLRFEYYFIAIDAFSKRWPDIAAELLQSADAMRKGARGLSSEVGGLHRQACDLASRAFLGLVPSRKYENQDLERLDDVFRGNGDPLSYAMLWNQIGVWAWARGDVELCRKIGLELLVPAIRNAKANCKVFGAGVFVEAAPTIYMAHSATMLSGLEELNYGQKESALSKTVHALLSRQPGGEPHEGRGRGRGYQVTPEVLNDAVRLCESMGDDASIYWTVSILCRAIGSESKPRLTSEQLSDARQKLLAIARRRMPDQKNIKHEGYLVVTEAALLGTDSTSKRQDWDRLLDRANAISNVSDAVFCIGEVVHHAPTKFSVERKRGIEVARSRVLEIPADVDRCCRYDSLAKNLEAVAPDFARECAVAGLRGAHVLSDAESAEERIERFIEVLYRADEKFAEKTIEALDNDPARREATWRAKRMLAGERVRDRLASFDEKSSLDEAELHHASDAAWKYLGMLNGGTQVPLSREAAVRLSEMALRFPMGRAYPLLALSVQSLVLRTGVEGDGGRRARSLFDSLLWMASACNSVARRLATEYTPWADNGGTRGGLFRPGDAELARSRVIEALGALREAPFVIICDPYFGPADLWIALEIGKISPNTEIAVVTGFANDGRSPVESDAELEAHWRSVGGTETGQIVSVVRCWYEDDVRPYIHDRWILSTKAGLRIGSSINAIGGARLFEVSAMRPEDCGSVFAMLEDVTLMRVRVEDGRRVRTKKFSL